MSLHLTHRGGSNETSEQSRQQLGHDEVPLVGEPVDRPLAKASRDELHEATVGELPEGSPRLSDLLIEQLAQFNRRSIGDSEFTLLLAVPWLLPRCSPERGAIRPYSRRGKSPDRVE